MGFFNFFKRKKKNTKEQTPKEVPLEKKKRSGSLFGAFKKLFFGTPKLDRDLIENIREVLITADLGTATTEQCIKKLKQHGDEAMDVTKAIQILKGHIKTLLVPQHEIDPQGSEETNGVHVSLLVGVNGTGKTTSIAKLAHRYVQAQQRVMICAADTFRAAAVAQLQVWGERLQVPVIVPTSTHKAPAAVVYNAVEQAMQNQTERLFIDTAGRLDNKANLMQELGKIKHVIRKKIPSAPQEIYLVIDGSTGQDAWMQAKRFHEALGGITGLIITKLDGVAKGGGVVGIVAELNIPVAYIGLGESMEDLVPFDTQSFVDRLFANTDKTEDA